MIISRYIWLYGSLFGMTFGCFAMVSSSISQMIPEKPIDIHFGGCFMCKIISLPDCSTVGRSATRWLESSDDLAFYIIKSIGGSCSIISSLTCWNCASVRPGSTSLSRVGFAIPPRYWDRLILLMKLEIKPQSDDHMCQRNRLLRDSIDDSYSILCRSLLCMVRDQANEVRRMAVRNSRIWQIYKNSIQLVSTCTIAIDVSLKNIQPGNDRNSLFTILSQINTNKENHCKVIPPKGAQIIIFTSQDHRAESLVRGLIQLPSSTLIQSLAHSVAVSVLADICKTWCSTGLGIV